MQVNLAPLNRIYVEAGPYVSLSEAELVGLSDGVLAASITLSGSVSLICDLGARYNLDRMTYHRTSAPSETVTFFGRQNNDDDWEQLTASGNGSLTVNFFGPKRFQFLRVIHEVSSGFSEIQELEIFTNDKNVLFGKEGLETNYAVDYGTSNLTAQEVKVYNPDSVIHDFYCLLDGEDLESLDLSLGLTSSGSFFNIYNTGLSVPETFPFSAGQFVETVEISNTVTLISGVSGFYYTPIIDIQNIEGRRLFWQATITGSNLIDETNSIDSEPTIGVRFSDTAPADLGWVSGQLSTDGNWHTTTGTLQFVPFSNHQILEPRYRRYFQARVEFSSPQDGDTPVLRGLGIEEGLNLNIPPFAEKSLFIRANTGQNKQGEDTSLVVWYFEPRDI